MIVSQYLGKRDSENGNLAASQVYRIAAVFSLGCMAFMLIFGKWILRLLYGSVDADVMEACRTYLWIVSLSFPANALYNVGAALYRILWRTVFSSWPRLYEIYQIGY